MRELDRLDRDHGLGAMPSSVTPLPRGRRHRRTGRSSPALAGLMITAVLLGGVVLVSPGSEFETVRGLLGIGQDRYASPPAYTPGEGSYAFLQTQPDSDEPVGYDPCSPVEYAVNPQDAPSDWRQLIDDSAAHTQWATGLELRYVGTTDDRPFADRPSGLAAGTSRPVVIGFADEDEVEQLAGNVAGLGGSASVRSTLGRSYYVTGSIALDTDVFDGSSWGEERRSRQAIVDHEFGHVVGLDHVDDPGELMFESNTGRSTYGPGDLEGLARIGSIPCR